MDRTVLIVTAIPTAASFAEALSQGADVVVEVVQSRRAALARLRRGCFRALLVDASLNNAETTTNDILWQNASRAVPIEVNLSALGALGVIRMLRSIVDGMQRAETHARDAARVQLAAELRSPLTGLLLHSQLLLREATDGKRTAQVPAAALREIHSIAEELRSRLHMPGVDLAPSTAEALAQAANGHGSRVISASESVNQHAG